MPEDDTTRGTAIIVGAGGGLGTAIVEELTAEGYPVALLARDDNRLQKHTAELAASGRTARAYRADAGDPENLSAAISKAADEMGEPDILLYNVAVLAPDKPDELTAAEWNSRFAVNMTGAKVAADAVLPRLRGGTARCCSPAAVTASTRPLSSRRCRPARPRCAPTCWRCSRTSGPGESMPRP
jgi:NADP-dependent 3-hydroxy acid dehydrogenase YdfG